MNTINPNQLPQVRWQNQNVITTELLAKCYGAKAIQIQQNHVNHQSRFLAGTHFFKIEGDDLKNLRLDNIESQISSKTRSLILWTEKGAARHSKILDTDMAWEMFDRLEEAYFHPERRQNALEDTVPMRLYADLQTKHIALQEKLLSAPKAVDPMENIGRPWTEAEDRRAIELRLQGYGFTRIGFALGRTSNGVKHRFVRVLDARMQGSEQADLFGG